MAHLSLTDEESELLDNIVAFADTEAARVAGKDSVLQSIRGKVRVLANRATERRIAREAKREVVSR